MVPPTTPLSSPFTPPLRGQADVEFVPATKRNGDTVTTTIKVKNLASGPIARLTIDETWFDKGQNIVAGGKGTLEKMLAPGAVDTITIQTAWNKNMNGNGWNFSHANGTVKPRRVAKIEGAASTPAKPAATEQVQAKPANWNMLNASEQVYWREHGTLPPSVLTPNVWRIPPGPAATTSTGCGRACGQLWNAEDFAASQRETEKLEREIAELDRQSNALSRISRGTQRPYAPASNSPLSVPSTSNRSSSGTSNRIGPFTFYNDSNGVSGTANRIGSTTFYNYSDGASGTANRIGQTTFYNFGNNKGDTSTGTSTTIGQFQFHNFSDGVTGTSNQVGGFTFHNFSDGTNCTTNRIGSFVYTNCN